MLKSISGQASAHCAAANASIAYDGYGFVNGRTDWNGNVTTYVNDQLGRQTSRTEASGTSLARTISTTWHPTFNLPTQIIEPGKTTTFSYDANGFLLTRTETDTTAVRSSPRTWSYSYANSGPSQEGLIASITDPRGNATNYGYDASNNLATITNALNQVTRIQSDASGRPAAVTDPNGVTTSFVYDPRGRVTSISTTGTAGSTSMTYDAVGQVTQVSLPDGSSLSYTYDAAHRLIGIRSQTGEEVDYTLDALGGRTLEQISGTGTLAKTQSRTFDELGRLLTTIGAANQTTTYAYDKDGNRISVTDPLNRQTTQAFDALNRLISVAAPLSSTAAYGYDSSDRLTAVMDPRELATTYAYNGFGDLISTTSPDTGTTAYVVDQAGNRTQQTDAGGVVVQFAYDTLNRVTSKTFPASPSETVTYQYDQASGVNGIGRLTSIADGSGTTSFVYDARGNVTQQTRVVGGVSYVTGYTYDAADHLIAITYPSGRIVNYTLDSQGGVPMCRPRRIPAR